MINSESPLFVETVSNEFIKVGTFVKVAKNDDKDSWYGTIIRSVGDMYIIADLPVNNLKEYISLREYDHLECRFNLYDGSYMFETRFIAFFAGLSLAILEKPLELTKTEIRENVRLPIYIPVRIDGFNNGIILNLSVGGLLIVTDEKYGIGSIIRLEFEMDNSQFEVKGQVVRVGANKDLGLKFVEEDLTRRIALDYCILRMFSTASAFGLQF